MVPILPSHLLGTVLDAGEFRDAWKLGDPVAEVCGAGPFVIDQYVSGQRLVLARNPHYWLRDEDGTKLPYLDRIVLEIVPDQNVEVLRLEPGEVDFISSELRPEDYPAIRRAADEGRLRLLDLGPGPDPDFLWFNLKPGAVGGSRPWLQDERLRQAVSHAVDRRTFANTVFLGQGVEAYGPITPGNHLWYAADVPGAGHDPARFALLLQKGQTLRKRTVAVIQQDLQKVGIQVDTVLLKFGALVERITDSRYEAVYLGLRATDTDPAMHLDFWLSSGAFHFWNPGQPEPSTEWERRIDDLMRRQASESDLDARRALFADVRCSSPSTRPRSTSLRRA